MNKNILENRLMEAMTRNSLYTYEFDVTTDRIDEEIEDRNGVNFTEILGLKVPCSFDAMMERAFGETLECRYTSESSVINLSRQALLNAFEKGKTKLEANIHYAAGDKYVRITYLLSRDLENGHVLAYVICDDTTDLEQMRGDSLHMDNKNLKRERDALTNERNDLTEERDDLTRQNSGLTEERDDLTRRNNNLTEERNVLSEENGELTRAADAVHFILNAGAFVCTYDPQGNAMLGIKYSHALRRLYGYSGEEEFPDLWTSWMDCILPEDRGYVENSYFAAVKDYTGQTLYDVTYRARQKDGTIRWQRAAASVLRRPDGTPIAGYGLVMDIDEQKKAADKIDAALTQARLANAAKTSFLARMSHDIRTPMNAIVGFTALAQTHMDNAEQVQDYLAKINTSSTHLLSLINDILDMSRIESGSGKLDEKPVHMPDLLHDLRTMIHGMINSKQQNLYIDTQDVMHEDVITDKLRLNQILINYRWQRHQIYVCGRGHYHPSGGKTLPDKRICGL